MNCLEEVSVFDAMMFLIVNINKSQKDVAVDELPVVGGDNDDIDDMNENVENE